MRNFSDDEGRDGLRKVCLLASRKNYVAVSQEKMVLNPSRLFPVQ